MAFSFVWFHEVMFNVQCISLAVLGEREEAKWSLTPTVVKQL